jgi:hypothetical protein
MPEKAVLPIFGLIFFPRHSRQGFVSLLFLEEIIP